MGLLRVGVLFGGKSAEHEISLQSAANVIEAMDPKKYEIIPIGIDKEGQWHLGTFPAEFTEKQADLKHNSTAQVAVIPGNCEASLVSYSASELAKTVKLDVVFPVIHGPLAEDGTVQGLLRLSELAFVGADVLGSSVGMDKDVMKRLLTEAHIANAKSITVYKHQIKELQLDRVFRELAKPVFVKPANMGSSVGVSKASSEKELEQALKEAFLFDEKLIIEEFIEAREIELAVLGNYELKVSCPGEIIPRSEFYSYEAKYLDDKGAELKIPANLSDDIRTKLEEIAKKSFRVLNCFGLARVDFFLCKDGRVLVNEINTLPGFTKISMYPKLWQESGLSYSELIDELIRLALERKESYAKLKRTYN